MKRNSTIARFAIATLVTASLIAVHAPASAQSKSMLYSNSIACGSPGYAFGNGQSYPTGSTVVAMTARASGGPSCLYRAVQLNWWNGSTYVATGWIESYAMTAAVGASASFGWAQHKLGYGPSGYTYEETSSWL